MALPIAHAAAGYLVHRATRVDDPARRRSGGQSPREDWRRAALFMFLGNVPDLDFMVGFVFGVPGMFHRGASHLVVTAVVFGLTVGIWTAWRGRGALWPTAFAFGAAYGSHLLVDFLTIDHRPPFGGQFLWPFSSQYLISPVTIFGEILIDGRTRADFLRTVLDWPTIWVLIREVVICSVAIGGWHLGEAWRARIAERELALGRGGEDLA